MAFVAPAGTTLVEHLGAGTTFDVAVVREGDVDLICKRLSSRLRVEPVGHEAMRREVTFLALAAHASIPKLVRASGDDAGPYVIEARMSGASLAALVEGLGERLPRALVKQAARASSLALAELHARSDDDGALSLVHGDLTPDHVLVDGDGAVAFVDFGASRFRGLGPSVGADDRGTLPYVAPEIARGETATDAAGDVYALAASLVAFASRVPLTSASFPAAMLVEIGERGVRLDVVNRCEAFGPRARKALALALAFDRRVRLTSARDLAEALAAGD